MEKIQSDWYSDFYSIALDTDSANGSTPTSGASSDNDDNDYDGSAEVDEASVP